MELTPIGNSGKKTSYFTHLNLSLPKNQRLQGKREHLARAVLHFS